MTHSFSYGERANSMIRLSNIYRLWMTKKRKQQSYIYSTKLTLLRQQRPGQLSQLITAQLKRYLYFFLQPLVIIQHTYIKDTSDFIRKIVKIRVPNEALIIVLDYESMYTNIVHDEVINAAYNTLSNDHMHQNINGIKRPSIDPFCQLVELAVKCNHFNFNGEHFYQCRGVAMGKVATPTICDIVIFYLKQRNVALSNDKIYKWLIFSDDVFALYFGNLEEATDFYKGQQHPTHVKVQIRNLNIAGHLS